MLDSVTGKQYLSEKLVISVVVLRHESEYKENESHESIKKRRRRNKHND